MSACPSCGIGKLSALRSIFGSLHEKVKCPNCGEDFLLIKPNFITIFLIYAVFSFVIFHISPGFVYEVALLAVLGVSFAAIIVFKSKFVKVKE